MLYCINPSCNNRENKDDEDTCSCRNPLHIDGKYWLIEPLSDLNRPFHDVFEVKDEENRQKVLKTLKSINGKRKEQFNREINFLIGKRSVEAPGFPWVESEDVNLNFKLRNGDNVPYFVMEYIQGDNLEQWSQENESISYQLVLDWVRRLAELLSQIHEDDFIYRDIKPSNIMMQSDGQLKFIDFGTIKQIRNINVDLQGITSVRSEGYTPDEQEKGKAVKKSDIFALGRTFVHLLTSKYPNELINPRTGNLDWREECNRRQQMPEPLLQLIDRMMVYPAENRPDTQEIIQEVERISNNLNTPVRPKPLQRLLNWFRAQNRRKVNIVVGFIVGLFLSVIIYCLLNSTPYACNLPPLDVSDMAFSPDGKSLATVSLDNTVRGFIFSKLEDQKGCKLHGGDPNGDGIVALKFKPLDSTKNETILATASLSSGAKLWNMNTDGSLSDLKDLLSDVPVVALAFSPQGSYLAIATSENDKKNDVKVYDMNKLNDAPKTIEFNQYIRDVSFSQGEQYLAILRLDNTVEWWKLQAPKYVDSFTKIDPEPTDLVALAFSPKGNYLALATSGDTVEVRDFNKDQMINKIKYNKYIKSISFSQDGQYLAIVGLDNKAQVWESQSTENGPTYEYDDVVALAFSPIENSNVLAKIDAKGKIEPINLTKR